MPDTKTLDDMVCLGCACLCDDVRLTITGQQVTAVERACRDGRDWFLQPTVAAAEACRVAGKRASLEVAAASAAELLAKAESPTIAGLAGVSIDAQRLAVAIADRLGGAMIGNDAASARAMATYGSVSATLGEVAQRADVVIFWRCDPATTHPRHFERYSLSPKSDWLPRGRADRTVFAVGSPDTRTATAADQVVPLGIDRDYEALSVLQAITRSLPLDSDHVMVSTGIQLETWQALADAANGVRYVAVFHGDELATGGPAAIGAMTRWMAELQNTTRAVSLPLGGGRHRANAAGASNVLAWQTGYAGDVDFSLGYPRPIANASVGDVLLTVSAEATAPPLIEACDQSRRIVLARKDDSDRGAAVRFRVAPPGFAERGAAYRSDSVALPLREPWATDALSAKAVLRAIFDQLERFLG